MQAHYPRFGRLHLAGPPRCVHDEAVIKALRAFGAAASTLVALCIGGALAVGVSAAVRGASAPTPVLSACTADPLLVGYSVQYSASLSSDAVTGVTVTDTAAAPDLAGCAGAEYEVTLRDAGGGTLGTVGGTVPPGVAEFSPPALPAPVSAAKVAEATLTLGH